MKFLNIYSYNNDNFIFKSQLNFNDTQLSQDSNVEIFMTKFGNTTIFSDGNFLYKLEKVIN